ncbi:OmpA family protein [Ekhidna sp.]|uniref:OmpA family protein n=1 Tax=Ekhidna sp. TaxID=2608089 RepID=UPI0032EAA9C1
MKVTINLIVYLIGLISYAQSITIDPVKKADKYFGEFSYLAAAELYKEVLPDVEENQPYVINQIALSYKNLNMSDSSEVWFKKTVDLRQDKPINYFYLGEALMTNGKYEEARYWLEEYRSEVPGDERVVRKLDAINNLEQFSNPIFQASIEAVGFNSPGLDFSPAFYRDGVVFVSSRPKNNWVQKEFNWDQSRFLDIYYAKANNVTYLEEGLNTPYHEGPLAFFNDDKSVVYTRNNFDGKKLNQDEKGVTNLKLFFAEWIEEKQKWDNEVPFPFNNEAFSNGSPAISSDGKVLIYSSNQPGGFGESDLYISFNEDGTWSEPKNLGSQINTKGRDGFPFLAGDQLFFASDGREGLGGLDIYSIGFSGKSLVGNPKNIGEPFNSRMDDFGLILKDNIGYFTSNRQKTTSDDIYKFSIKKPDYVVVMGEVFDKDSETGISKADVIFKNENGEYLYTRSGIDGTYQLMAPLTTRWQVSAGKYRYELVDVIDREIENRDTVWLDRIYLKLEKPNDGIDIPDAATIVDNRIKPYEDTSPFVDEFSTGDTLKFDMVYFDLDKSDLRKRSKDVLTKAANFMIEHVDVRIVLTSHTDSRAGDSYNRKLARRRSNSVAFYLIEMGVNAERIDKVNVGEDHLVNTCEDEIECDEDQHQQNRRTEVSFVKREI